MDPLVRNLKRIRRRLLAVRAAEAGLQGATAAAALAIFLTGVRILLPHSLPLLATHPGWPITLVPLGFAAFTLARLVRGVSLQEAAIEADRAADLKERLSTAYEVLTKAKLAKRGLAPFPAVQEKVPVPVLPSVAASPLAAFGSETQARRGEGGARGDAVPAGLLDDRLIAQARDASAALDAAHLPMARALNRRLRNLLVGLVLVLAGGFIPSVGGPVLPPGVSERAATQIQEAAASKTIAPAIRSAVEKALESLQAPGVTQGDIDKATSPIYVAARKAAEDRKTATRLLTKIDSPEVREMVRTALAGNPGGASAAGKSLADKVSADPGSGGMPLEDRERLADSLTGTAVEAKKTDLLPLAAALNGAADAVKRPDAGKAGEAFGALAAAMTEALGQEAGGGIPALVSAVRKIRQESGLPDLPSGDVPGEAAPSGVASTIPPVVGDTPAALPATGTVGAGTAPPIPPDVKPEDRDVVRRYFGG